MGFPSIESTCVNFDFFRMGFPVLGINCQPRKGALLGALFVSHSSREAARIGWNPRLPWLDRICRLDLGGMESCGLAFSTRAWILGVLLRLFLSGKRTPKPISRGSPLP